MPQVNTINNDFFRRIGELLGHLVFRQPKNETVSVFFDERTKKVIFRASRREKTLTYSIDARSLAITNVSLSRVADAIIEIWE